MAKVTIEEIQKLRKMTGAGMMDCKKALAESDGDVQGAIEIIRKKGQAVAAKRSDREASEGCVLVKSEGKFGAIVALNCETDFVAKNEDFVKLTQDILDAAVAAQAKSMEEVLGLKLHDATVQEAITGQSGITGEKMELGFYQAVEGEYIATYNHQGKNLLCTLAAFNKAADEELAHEIVMQIAAMNPLAIDEDGVPAEVFEREKQIAIDKTREEGKPENLLERIAMGRMQKFFSEVCLMKQQSIIDGSKTVGEMMKASDKDLKCVAMKRFTLREE